jgi:hypothetical protein
VPERHLIEFEEVLRVSGQEGVKRAVTETLRSIAAEAEQIAAAAGGGAAGQSAGRSYAETELATYRRQLEQSIVTQRGTGDIGRAEQTQAARAVSASFESLRVLPGELRSLIRASAFESQQAIRREVRAPATQAGAGGGVVPPILPPGAAGKATPGPEPRPPTRGVAEEATEAARTSLAAVQTRAAALRRMVDQPIEGQMFAAVQAENVRAGYALHAAVLEELSSTTEYAQVKAAASRYQAQNNAQVQRFLAVDGDYARARAQSARDTAIQSAAQQQLLAVDGTYARAQAVVTRSKSIQSAAQQQLLAVDDRYISSQSVIARAKAEQQAKIQSNLATDDRYAAAQATVTRARTEQSARVQGMLATDDRYLAAQTNVARAKAQQQARVETNLQSDTRYIAAQADVARAKSRQAAAVQEDLASTSEYARSQARATRAKAEITARAEAELASTDEYASAQARAARSRAQIDSRTQALLAADTEYIAATVNAARSRDQIAAQQARLGLQPQNLNASVQRQLAEQELARERQIGVQRNLLEEPGQFGIQHQAELKTLNEAVARQRDIIVEQNRMEDEALAQTVRLTQLKEERTTLERAGARGLLRRPGESVESLQGRTAAMDQSRVAARRIAQLEEINANTNGVRDEIVRQRVLEREVNLKLEQEVRAQRVADNGGQRILGGGSMFQRLQASIQARRTGDVVDPERLMGLGQFVASRAVTTAGFMLSGAALFGSIQAIRTMVKESEDLERIFSLIQAQFRSVGDANQFSGFRSAMFDISRETGVAASEVATVGFQLKGVYGNDTQRAIRETAGAIKVAVVTGIEQKELTDSLTAASIAYGVSIEDIGDKAIGLEERFGVLSKESLKVFGDMSAVAKEAGLSLTDLGAIVGTIQQASGRSGQSVAEALGRILPGVQKQALPLLQLYNETPELQGSAPKIREALASGESGQVLTQLIRDWGKLDQTTKNYVVTLLGGRREASTLIPLFNNTSKAIAEMDRTQGDQGKTSQRFADLQQTLAQAVARFRAEMVNLGNDLARSGLLDAFRDLAGAGIGMVKVLDLIVHVFNAVNQAVGGVPGRIIAITLAVVALTKAWQLLQAVRSEGLINTALGSTLARGIGGVGAQSAEAAAQATLPGIAEQIAPVAAGGFLGRAGASLGGLGARVGGLFARLGQGSMFTEAGMAPALAGGLTTGALAVSSLMLERAWQNRSNVQQSYAGNRARVEGVLAQTDLQTLLRNREQGKFGSSFMDKVGAFGLGQVPLQTLANREINRQTLAQVEEAKRNGLLSTFSDKELQALRDNKGGGKEGQRARKLLANLPEEQQAKLRDAMGAQATRQDALDDILKNGGTKLATTVEDLQAQFQAGEIGSEEYLAGLQKQLELVRSIDTTPETHQQLLTIQRQINTEFTNRTVQGLQGLQKLQQLAGLDAGAIIPFARAVLAQGHVQQQAIETIKATLAGPGTGLDIRPNIAPKLDPIFARPDILADIRPDIRPDIAPRLSTQPQFAGVQIPQGGTPGITVIHPGTPEYDAMRANDALIRAGGQPMPPGVGGGDFPATPPRVLSTDEAFGAANVVADAQKQAWLDSIARAPSASAADQLLKNPPKLDDQTVEAIKKYYKEKYNLDVDPTIGPTFDQIQQARQNALNEQVATLTAATAGSRDPAAQASTALKIANAQLGSATNETQRQQALGAIKEANAQAVDVQRGIDEANVALYQAQNPRDRIAQARAGQQQAAIAAKYAQGAAAQAQALAQRIAADRTMQDAMYDISQSRVRLLQAQATAAGDDIGAAKRGVELAQNDLDKAIREHADEGVINDLTAARDTAQNQLRQTTLQTREDDIQFNLDMKRITMGQAIAQLEALMSIANPKEQQDLMRRIKQLRDQAGQDLQFNIPSEIKLPTLYEVRRYQQTPAGSGYNDNRTVSLVMHVNNGMDQAAATQWLTSVIGRAPRVVAGTRRA